MTTVLPIVRASAIEIRDAAALIAAALHPQPLGAWLVPDEHHRGPVLTAWARIWTEHAFLWGHIHLHDTRTAVAVWLTHNRTTIAPVDYQRRLTNACGPHLHRFQILDELLDSTRPTEPHHHLVFLATHPDHQGAGHANTLLRHHEPGSLPAWSQAISPAGIRLLTKHGFVGRDPVALPDDAGQIAPMWRPTQTAPDAQGPCSNQQR
ncbi:hypothetical protein GCM10022225_27330 [Plantactinospora mayteni]|uniref:N-acetyltransferase domain-containing protein n=1 Tax=Plantactinospora mayteni TaxID=566021 RepID=A0ABQ4EIH5_9ACTN|nr:N-acetyltransferase [Plantactinospora mayteni]GIG94537.1 hypothetical protein Pma05_11100 [Plantactinospora mayteni]